MSVFLGNFQSSLGKLFCRTLGNSCFSYTSRSSLSDKFYKIDALKNFKAPTKVHLQWSPASVKLQALPRTLQKKESIAGVFLWTFVNFFRSYSIEQLKTVPALFLLQLIFIAKQNWKYFPNIHVHERLLWFFKKIYLLEKGRSPFLVTFNIIIGRIFAGKFHWTFSSCFKQTGVTLKI